MLVEKMKDTKIKKQSLQEKGSVITIPFGTVVDNFYITDFIGENSAIMAKASKVRIKKVLFKEKSIFN